MTADLERLLSLVERYAVLRPPRARRCSARRCSRSSSSVVAEGRLLGVLVVPQPLLPGVGLDERDLLWRAAAELEVAQRLGIDREDRAGRAELRRHVADRRAVGERQGRQSGAVELDELADDAVLAQHLGDRQHQVGRGRALGQLAVEPEADHLRDQHRHRLAEHRRLGLDPADAPAEHAEAVDHRRVRVGADERVRVGLRAGSAPVSLTNTTRARYSRLTWCTMPVSGGTTLKLSKRRLPPAQECVALLVALELELGVALERAGRPELVDLHGVVDHQLGGHQRVDLAGVAAHRRDRIAHRREVDDRRDAGEVLHDHARGRERDLLARLGLGVPTRRAPRCRCGPDRLAVLVPQQVLEQDLERERQPRDVVSGLQRVEPEDLVGPSADLKSGLRSEAVG